MEHSSCFGPGRTLVPGHRMIGVERMRRTASGIKPRITELAKLEELVGRLKRAGIAPDDIQRHIVSVAVVDLDDLNEVLKAA